MCGRKKITILKRATTEIVYETIIGYGCLSARILKTFVFQSVFFVPFRGPSFPFAFISDNKLHKSATYFSNNTVPSTVFGLISQASGARVAALPRRPARARHRSARQLIGRVNPDACRLPIPSLCTKHVSFTSVENK